jgi:hypothetical protein
MIVSWKLVRTSLALSACLGLLAACQDRGAFKSKTWTPEQIKENLAAKDAAAAKQASANANDPSGVPIAPNDPKTGVAGGPVGAPLSTTKNDPAPAAPPAPAGPQGTGGSASIQTLIEGNADEFMAGTLKLSKQNDPIATKTFKALTLTVTGKPTQDLNVALDLGVMIGTDLRFVNAASKLSSSDKDQKVQKLAYVSKDSDGNDVNLTEQQLNILAVCKDLKCSELDIQVKAQVDGGTTTLALVARAIGDKMEIDTINVQVQSFEDLTKPKADGDNKPAADAKGPKKDGADNTPTTVTEDDQAAAGQKGSKDKTDDAGGSSDVKKDQNSAPDKKADTTAPDKKVDTTPAPDKKADTPAPDKKADTTPAPDKKADAPAAATSTAPAFAFKPAADSTASVAPKSVVFKQTADSGTQSSGFAAVDMKPISKPITVAQDPGAFSLQTQVAAKAPGIFGTVQGATQTAVNKVDSAPAATVTAPAPAAAPAATIDTSSANAEKDNQATAAELKKESDAKATADAKAKVDQDAIESLSAFYN